jgi:hypothetical protein
MFHKTHILDPFLCYCKLKTLHGNGHALAIAN